MEQSAKLVHELKTNLPWVSCDASPSAFRGAIGEALELLKAQKDSEAEAAMAQLKAKLGKKLEVLLQGPTKASTETHPCTTRGPRRRGVRFEVFDPLGSETRSSAVGSAGAK